MHYEISKNIKSLSTKSIRNNKQTSKIKEQISASKETAKDRT